MIKAISRAGLLVGASNCFFTLFLVSTASGQSLPRKAALGLAMKPTSPELSVNPVIDRVFPGQTAERIGLRTGDVIVSAGGKPTTGAASVIDYASQLVAGQPVQLRVLRGKKALTLKGRAMPRPFETYANATVSYGEVPFRGGKLRDILVLPRGVTNPPVLFLLPGYTCGSIEQPITSHPYRRLGEEMIARGIGYYRVEKPFVGDSHGGLTCEDIDFATELDAFRTAYKALASMRHVEPDRVFMLGHSLGGLEAPLLAKETPPRGVAVYGTVLRNWADYHRDVDAYQSFMFTGDDPGKSVEQAERNREIFRRFYFGRESPAQIASGNPADEAVLRNVLGWDGGERTIGDRSFRFMQDLAHLPLAAAWRDARTNVLALYGESDIVALNDEDHRLIADIADFHRPGSGTFNQIAATSHGMELVGNRHEVRAKAIATGQVQPGPFNTKVSDALADWIKQAMGRQPVRLQEFSQASAEPK